MGNVKAKKKMNEAFMRMKGKPIQRTKKEYKLARN